MHIPLLKNEAQLKQKSDKQPKKKINHLNLLKNKNHVHKKKINKSHLNPKKKKKKAKEEKKKMNTGQACPVNQKKK